MSNRPSNGSTSVSKFHSSREVGDVTESAWETERSMRTAPWPTENHQVNKNAHTHLWHTNTAVHRSVVVKAQDSIKAHSVDKNLHWESCSWVWWKLLIQMDTKQINSLLKGSTAGTVQSYFDVQVHSTVQKHLLQQSYCIQLPFPTKLGKEGHILNDWHMKNKATHHLKYFTSLIFRVVGGNR